MNFQSVDKDIRNMNSLLLYYITQCYGLSPFKYNKSTSRIFESNAFTLFNLIAGCFFCFLTIAIQSYTILTWVPERPKVVLLIVSSLEGLFLIIQNVFIFLIHFCNRKKLVKFINEGFDLTSELKKFCPQESIFSTKFRTDLRSKFISKSVQIVLLVTSTFLFCVRDNNISEWIFGLLASIMYVFPMCISSIYYCGSVLISARFYEILNTKIASLISIMNTDYKSRPYLQMQLFCDISDEIDYIAVLYNRIVSFVELINKHFSVQIVIIKLCSFVLIISAVIFRSLILQIDRKSN